MSGLCKGKGQPGRGRGAGGEGRGRRDAFPRSTPDGASRRSLPSSWRSLP